MFTTAVWSNRFQDFFGQAAQTRFEGSVGICNIVNMFQVYAYFVLNVHFGMCTL